MEGGEGRGFKEISVSVCGVQPPTKLDDSHPNVAPWRNNLTGLSQVWNLYFIAHQDRIYIYQPQYPTQRISSKPALVLPLPVSQPGLQGYIDDYHYPHAVNNLLIADLGEQEVLACVCDDGDVVVYHTRTIFDTLKRTSKPRQDDAKTYHEIRPFFIDNVGLSAWGLAVHTASRMLAVSSNTGNITVFAFALTKTLDPDEAESSQSNLDQGFPDSSHDDLWSSKLESFTDQILEPTPPDRSSNQRITLTGNNTNIPNIAFCNTHEDSEGRYLLSTDISGLMVGWDIWARTPVSMWTFVDIIAGQFSPQTTRGWGVLCLDPRSFRYAQGFSQIFGCTPKRDKNRQARTSWSNTDSRVKVKDSTVWHGRNFTNNQDPSFVNMDDDIFKFYLPHMCTRSIHQPCSISEYYGAPVSNHPAEVVLPFEVLHTTAGTIRLIANTLEGPSLVCRSPLVQIPSNNNHVPNIHERLNMLAQAPELGLVFVATQAGRVAILGLMQGTITNVQEKAFRLEAFLPLKSQEEQGLRPNVPLLGLAIGPIQTRAMDSAEAGGQHQNIHGRREQLTKRLRLMMTYYDRTVMSYEISRTDSASYEVKNELLAL